MLVGKYLFCLGLVPWNSFLKVPEGSANHSSMRAQLISTADMHSDAMYATNVITFQDKNITCESGVNWQALRNLSLLIHPLLQQSWRLFWAQRNLHRQNESYCKRCAPGLCHIFLLAGKKLPLAWNVAGLNRQLVHKVYSRTMRWRYRLLRYTPSYKTSAQEILDSITLQRMSPALGRYK